MERDRHPFAAALKVVVATPLDQSDEEALVQLAIRFWYANLNLEGELGWFLGFQNTEIELRRAGYTLQRLTRFHCAPHDRCIHVLDLLPTWFPKLRNTQNREISRGKRVDTLALSWGLPAGFGLKVQVLLPFQTRHINIDSLDIN